LEVVARAGDVAQQLARFHRTEIESGQTFSAPEFETRHHRADKQLLDDVNYATDQLIERGLDKPSAHALIERVLLVRYLEDRHIITSEYFRQVAASNSSWEARLDRVPNEPILNRSGAGFETVLSNKEFTYAVFDRLAVDFNGDLFVASNDEKKTVMQTHLDLIQSLLLGTVSAKQNPLFLWAYDFGIVPTGLISSMYEQFVHREAEPGANRGTYYTPPELVEFVLNEVLTPSVLATSPRVLDPACGSGLFLVEAFRAIVRYEIAQKGRSLTSYELQSILRSRVAGIDINPQAVRLAAFSLYLALLDYQRPQDILEAGPLPPLIMTSSPDSGRTLFVGDAFCFAQDEPDATEISLFTTPPVQLPWPLASFDVVVGNPPWDDPPKERDQVDHWADASGLPVGNRSRSQLFVWRALSLLREGGIAGLLLSVGVVSDDQPTSILFRRRWISESRIIQCVNFSYARRLFFRQASAPFVFMHFVNEQPIDNWFAYLTARQSLELTKTGIMAFGRLDRRLVRQDDLVARDYLWKTYSCGSHRDAALLQFLDTEMSLQDVLSAAHLRPAYGWQNGTKPPTGLVATAPVLDPNKMVPWGPLKDDWFSPPPARSKWATQSELYRGQRIVVSRQAMAHFGPYARLETSEFTFRHVGYGIPLQTLPTWKAKVVFAILISSLYRYRLFMTSGRWGTWFDEVSSKDIRSMPVRFTSHSDPTVRRIVRVVDELRTREFNVQAASLFAEPSGHSSLETYLDRLNEAVFDLFGLSQDQRDLVRDFHAYGPLATREVGHDLRLPSVRSGKLKEVIALDPRSEDLRSYLRAFLERWNAEIAPTGEFWWNLYRAKRQPIIAVVFSSQRLGEEAPQEEFGGEEAWQIVIDRLQSAIHRRVSRALTVEGSVRGVTDSEIIIAKRSEPQLWTASAAREDAEAAFVQLLSATG
jgi:hypothetical protein